MRSLELPRARRASLRSLWRATGAVACFVILACGVAQAADRAACDSFTEPTTVVACALAQSPALRLEQQETQVLLGQRLRARSLLPTHPLVQVSFAGRRPPSVPGATDPATTLNWYVTLSQEIEIAGQRGARVRAAELSISAQGRRVFITAQEVVAQALTTYYELLAAQEAVELGREVARIASLLSTLGTARAQAALTSAVDSHAAQAEAARLSALRFEAERREGELRTDLATLLGTPRLRNISGSLDVLPDAGSSELPITSEGSLEPVIEQALRLRADVAVARFEQEARSARVQVLRRERVPNLTLSFLAQRDGFDEQVIGGGLALPLPLPAPLGPSRAGEIAAAQAQVTQAEITIERVQRQVRAEVQRAVQREQSYAAQLRMFPAALATQARADLAALSQAIAGRAMATRDALLLERTLVEFLITRVEIRRGLALSRIERLRATGQPMGSVAQSPGGQP